MAAHETDKPKSLRLPLMAASPSDIVRLSRELELVDEALLQAKLKSGTEAAPPKASRLMEQAAEINKLDLMQPADRATLKKFLDDVKRHAPVFHISFSADPSPMFIEKLMTWLRREIDPLLLLTVGLQPNIGAGCVLRTVNKQFDMSLRRDFEQKRELLLKQLAGPAAATSSPPPASATAPAAKEAVA